MTIFVGGDWAETHHEVHLMNDAGDRPAAKRFPEGLKARQPARQRSPRVFPRRTGHVRQTRWPRRSRSAHQSATPRPGPTIVDLPDPLRVEVRRTPTEPRRACCRKPNRVAVPSARRPASGRRSVRCNNESVGRGHRRTQRHHRLWQEARRARPPCPQPAPLRRHRPMGILLAARQHRAAGDPPHQALRALGNWLVG